MIIAIVLLALLAIALVAVALHLNRRLTERTEQLHRAEIAAATTAERLEAMQSAVTDEERFRTLAKSVLADSQTSLRQESSRQIEELLKPLRDNLTAFSRTIDEKYTREAQERYALREKIDELRVLNDSLGREARDLSRALRGNSKVQGDWGEMVLENLLVKAGFERNKQYAVQLTRDALGNPLRDEAGRLLRPDVVVYFPPKNCVVIDSKVSLTAYVNYAAATTDAEREVAGRAHIASIRSHVKELAVKRYQDFVGDNHLDFVMMFIPNESAYIVAMQLDDNLWQEAYESRVMIMSPAHLFSMLKLVQQMWRQDSQARNAVEIAQAAGDMYDKFAGFVDDILKVKKNLDNTSAAFDEAYKKLHTGRGNLVSRAEKLKALGVKATKQLRLDSDDE